MGVFGVHVGATQKVDGSTPETRIENEGLSHHAQGLSLGHQQQTAS